MSTQNYEELIDLYGNINLYCLIGALVFLALAVFLFFWLKIPRVFGELTGRTAQREIAEMLAENAESGSLTSIKIGSDGRQRRKGRTSTLGGTGRLRKNTGRMSRKLAEDITSGDLGVEENVTPAFGVAAVEPYSQPTEPILQYEGEAPTDVLDSYGSQPTDVLGSYGEQPTDVLSSYGEQPTDVLDSYGSQPTNELGSREFVYQQPESETMVLNQNVMNMNTGFVFVIERSIVEIHTNEVI